MPRCWKQRGIVIDVGATVIGRVRYCQACRERRLAQLGDKQNPPGSKPWAGKPSNRGTWSAWAERRWSSESRQLLNQLDGWRDTHGSPPYRCATGRGRYVVSGLLLSAGAATTVSHGGTSPAVQDKATWSSGRRPDKREPRRRGAGPDLKRLKLIDERAIARHWTATNVPHGGGGRTNGPPLYHARP